MTLCLNRTKERKLQGKVFYFIYYLTGQDKCWNVPLVTDGLYNSVLNFCNYNSKLVSHLEYFSLPSRIWITGLYSNDEGESWMVGYLVNIGHADRQPNVLNQLLQC